MTKFADRFSLPFARSTFGNRFGVTGPFYGPEGHRGTDFIVAANTPVPTIGNGEVSHVLWSDALGNVVVVRHYLPGPGNDVYSFSCHLNRARVKAGQLVNRLQIIADSGSTGLATTGPHLHLAMSKTDMGGITGEVFDPIAWIENFTPGKAATFTPKYTTAQRGEGLIAIAARSRITFPKIKQLNPNITAPDYIVRLGQKVRID